MSLVLEKTQSLSLRSASLVEADDGVYDVVARQALAALHAPAVQAAKRRVKPSPLTDTALQGLAARDKAYKVPACSARDDLVDAGLAYPKFLSDRHQRKAGLAQAVHHVNVAVTELGVLVVLANASTF